MSITEIEAALAQGLTVAWKTPIYVVRGKPGNLMLLCTANNHCIGITAAHLPEDFFILA